MNHVLLKYISYLVIITYISAFSQTKIHKTLTTDDGLIYGEITDILKDSYGYLWISTLNGLSKWDSKTFQNYSTVNGLAGSQVLDIEEGPDSTLYFSTFGYGITLLKNNVFDTLNTEDGLVTNFVSKVYFNKQGKMYIGAGGELFEFQNGNFENISRKLKIPVMGIRDIAENYKGDIFVATYNGLIKISGNQFKLFTINEGLNINYVTGLAITENDSVYVSTDAGCNKIEGNKALPIFYKNKKITTPMEDVTIGDDNILYFGSEKGLYKLNEGNTAGKIELVNESNGLNNNRIGSLFSDENGIIYIGTKQFGLNIYKPGLLENFTQEQGLENSNITFIDMDNKRNLLLGTKEGIYFFDVKNNLLRKKNKGLPNIIVNVMKPSINGALYIGTPGGLIKQKGAEVERVKLFDENVSPRIVALDELNDGTLLIGKMDGLITYKDKPLKKITTNEGLPSNYVQSILKRKNGSIVIGTHGKGAVEFSGSEFRDYKTLITEGIINCLFESPDSTLWLGTEGKGVVKINNNKLQYINSSMGLSSNNILGLTGDQYGNVYLSTPKGVNIIYNSNEKFLVRAITKQDGLISNQCNLNAIYYEEPGTLWIGTNEGLTKYDAENDKISMDPPKTYLTGLEIFNKPVNFQDFKSSPILNHDENYLKFYFTGIDLLSSHKVKFSYRLYGVNRNWVTGKSTSVQYTNLDDGEYTFEVKAANEWGKFSKAAVLKFIILPAWWETWWFYTISIFLLVFIVAFIAAYRYRSLLAVERIRTKISRDLHDNVGSGLSQISILTELIQNQLPEDKSEIKKSIKNINEISGSLVESMSDIVWLINPKKDSLKDLILHLRDSYHEIMEYSKIDFVINNILFLDNIRLSLNYRQHLYLILKEAVNNSLKYSEADVITLDLSVEKNFLKILFSDNGKGFDINNVKMGNGLMNMKKRSDEIGAKIDYFSEINKGSRIIFEGKIK